MLKIAAGLVPSWGKWVSGGNVHTQTLNSSQAAQWCPDISFLDCVCARVYIRDVMQPEAKWVTVTNSYQKVDYFPVTAHPVVFYSFYNAAQCCTVALNLFPFFFSFSSACFSHTDRSHGFSLLKLQFLQRIAEAEETALLFSFFEADYTVPRGIFWISCYFSK